jgi:hypothetical protein
MSSDFSKLKIWSFPNCREYSFIPPYQLRGAVGTRQQPCKDIYGKVAAPSSGLPVSDSQRDPAHAIGAEPSQDPKATLHKLKTLIHTPKFPPLSNGTIPKCYNPSVRAPHFRRKRAPL